MLEAEPFHTDYLPRGLFDPIYVSIYKARFTDHYLTVYSDIMIFFLSRRN